MERCQIAETLHQVRRHGDFWAQARLVARRVGLYQDDRRILVKVNAYLPQHQDLRHPQARLEHVLKRHTGQVGWAGGDKGVGFPFDEVVGNLLEIKGHATPVLLPF